MKIKYNKDIFYLVTELLLINAVGIILSYLNFLNWVNIIIYFILIGEITWYLRKFYICHKPNLKSKNRLPLILFWAFLLAMEITLLFYEPPKTCVTSYLLTEGCLLSYRLLLTSKKGKHENAKYIAVVIFSISVLIGIANLFDLATHR